MGSQEMTFIHSSHRHSWLNKLCVLSPQISLSMPRRSSPLANYSVTERKAKW